MLGDAKAVHKIRQRQVFLSSHTGVCSLAPLQLHARVRPVPLHAHFCLLSPCFPWAWELDGNGGGMCWSCVPDLGSRRPPMHPSKIFIWRMSGVFCLLDLVFWVSLKGITFFCFPAWSFCCWHYVSLMRPRSDSRGVRERSRSEMWPIRTKGLPFSHWNKY